MSDTRIVQCFGTLRRPRQEDKPCRRRFLWTSRGGKESHFGRKGAQACPHCGTMPDFRHPHNQFLDGGITEEKAKALMPAYIEMLRKEQEGKK